MGNDNISNQNVKSKVLVFSSPSGAGKTTIVKKLYAKYEQLVISISATTRARRPAERNGVDYFFINRNEFEKLIKEEAFLEYEMVHGEYYGTLRSVVDDLIQDGKVLLFDIDVNGAQNVKNMYPDAILFFIKPPDLDTLKERLRLRESESEAEIQNRLERMDFEYIMSGKFDHIILNDSLDNAVKQIESIIFV